MLAVVLLLTGIAVPMVSGYVQEGRRARAEKEIEVIAAAVRSFYKDLGVWPARASTGADNRLYVLCSGPGVPSSNPFRQSHPLSIWLLDGEHGDTLDNHLLSNTPGRQRAAAYPTTGSVRWRGPYSEGGVSVDPWGRPYLVTVVSGFSVDTDNYKRLFVLSAGPDGVLDTVGDLGAMSGLSGDDVGVVLSQRQ